MPDVPETAQFAPVGLAYLLTTPHLLSKVAQLR